MQGQVTGLGEILARDGFCKPEGGNVDTGCMEQQGEMHLYVCFLLPIVWPGRTQLPCSCHLLASFLHITPNVAAVLPM